ncbi:Hydrogenase 3 maturation protease [Salinivirga cyanobacteriivorans]|uniref:Hydrogenase 3 maturation protease n=2 Tax=Salinivirga cyanobacteriivorans TaxID=1307839 RepID=A0A0S2HY39_9BACT|nr:Hydrogenase 3 maturation protease [Salinivirga cyanobacteriivorans]
MLFVGIGNVLKRDDGVGVFISQNLEKNASVDALTVEVSIENYIGKINSLAPEKLILIDCVDFGKDAGYYKLTDLNTMRDFTTNTHNISLGRLKDLFVVDDIKVLGIQPGDVSFGEGLTQDVEKTAFEVLRIITQQLQHKNN